MALKLQPIKILSTMAFLRTLNNIYNTENIASKSKVTVGRSIELQDTLKSKQTDT